VTHRHAIGVPAIDSSPGRFRAVRVHTVHLRTCLRGRSPHPERV